MQQEERVLVKQGKLGYFIGHQTHVQSAEAEEEVVVKPGEGPLVFLYIFFVPMHVGPGDQAECKQGPPAAPLRVWYPP